MRKGVSTNHNNERTCAVRTSTDYVELALDVRRDNALWKMGRVEREPDEV